MKDTVKKVMNFRFDRYRDAEIQLEKLAEKGFILKECGNFLWTFARGEPKKLKYTITYFSEGSVFNPDITENQQVYFDYAKAAGWNFVAQLNQMQIFCNEADTIIPFETDEREKLNNIRRCMNKSFVPAMVVLLLVCILNLNAQFNSFRLGPVDFLADYGELLSVSMFLVNTIYFIYSLLDYFVWCKRSEQSLASGGTCFEGNSMVHKIVDIIFIGLIIGMLCGQLLFLGSKISFVAIFLCIAQVPIQMYLFKSSIQYLKKKKASAMLNKVISITVLVIVTFAYAIFIMWFLFTYGMLKDTESDYRTVTWQLTEATSHDYKLYSDEIPLTCEDLYGEIDYDYYSYEKELESTFLLKKSAYDQDSLPAKNGPPQLEYEILESEYDFVFQIAKNYLLEIPQWQQNMSYKIIDNDIFSTLEAYQKYYGDDPTGKYILIYHGKVIVLNVEEPPTKLQIDIIKDKLID